MDYLNSINEIVGRPELFCPVCGSSLYLTGQNEKRLTFHCSSEHARFWDQSEGTRSFLEAKFHWDRSAQDVHIDF
jgi:hypothetical protein